MTLACQLAGHSHRNTHGRHASVPASGLFVGVDRHNRRVPEKLGQQPLGDCRQRRFLGKLHTRQVTLCTCRFLVLSSYSSTTVAAHTKTKPSAVKSLAVIVGNSWSTHRKRAFSNLSGQVVLSVGLFRVCPHAAKRPVLVVHLHHIPYQQCCLLLVAVQLSGYKCVL